MKKVILALVFFLLFIALFMPSSKSEEHGTESIPVYVTADILNLRSRPSRQGVIVTEQENGDELTATGKWSKDHQWIEILHSEYGYVWCNYHYVTERKEAFDVETLWDSPIKIRKQAFSGKVTGYLKKGKTLRITQTILGWGKSQQGWIDLDYCIEIER